jgi:hypothetical protein
MQLHVDVRQPATTTAQSAELSDPWSLGPIAVDDGPRTEPARSAYSFLADCECPDDCLRDHENE